MRSRNHGEASKNLSFAMASGQKDGGADDNLRIRHVMATKMEATSMCVPGSPILKHFRARCCLVKETLPWGSLVLLLAVSESSSALWNRGGGHAISGPTTELEDGPAGHTLCSQVSLACSSHRAASAPQPAWERGMRRIGSRHSLRNMAAHSIQKTNQAPKAWPRCQAASLVRSARNS